MPVMTLGPLVYEAQGKVLEMKRLPNGDIESTVVLKGLFLGEEFSGTWVGEEELGQDSTSHVKVEGSLTTKSGVTINAIGVGSGIRRGSPYGIQGKCLPLMSSR